jgi:hypothetical protein
MENKKKNKKKKQKLTNGEVRGRSVIMQTIWSEIY